MIQARPKRSKKKSEFYLYGLIILLGFLAFYGIKGWREDNLLKTEREVTTGRLDYTHFDKGTGTSGPFYLNLYAFSADGKNYHATRNVKVSDYNLGHDSIPEFIEVEYARSNPKINRAVGK